jgi:hypothetical protein
VVKKFFFIKLHQEHDRSTDGLDRKHKRGMGGSFLGRDTDGWIHFIFQFRGMKVLGWWCDAGHIVVWTRRQNEVGVAESTDKGFSYLLSLVEM